MIDKILINGKIYTENPSMPWAQAIAIDGKIIAAIGTDEEISSLRDSRTKVIDLNGRTVLPGLIDGHTHPETVSKTYWHVVMPLHRELIPLLDTIREYAEKYPKEKRPYFFGENYYTETFGSAGPRKELLDEIFPDRPARIQDFGDHACWYNSIALEMLKDPDGIPRCKSIMGDAEFITDEKGEYTGWAKEAGPESDEGIYGAIGWRPPETIDDEMAGPLLDFFKEYGIMCLMDGFTEGEDNLKYFYDLDQRGALGMYYDASVLLETAEELEDAIDILRTWQKKYTTDHIHCNIIKFFLDGTNELGDCLSTEPFHNDPSGTDFGSSSCTTEELTDVMVRLNEKGIDLHIHTICDGAFREVCDAFEAAKKIAGDDWKIYVTMAHCELIHPDDIHRVHELGLYVDWSPHWSGGYFGEEAISYLGKKRWETMYDFTKILKDGDHVGFSSDIFSYQEAARANPFFGMQVAMTRIDPEYPLDPERFEGSIRPSKDAILTLEQLIHGYTVTNARRMRKFDIMGSLESGKLANFVVLEDDIFTTPPEKVKDIRPYCTYFEGEKRHIQSIMKAI